MHSPDDDNMHLYEPLTWPHVDRSVNGPRREGNGQCSEHQQTREHFQSIENSLSKINDTLAKIDKDLIATISAGKVKSGVIAATVTIVLLFGGYWVSEFRELKTTVSRGMELRVNNAARLEGMERDIVEIKAEIHRYQQKWEASEQLVHGTGVEKHHLENGK